MAQTAAYIPVIYDLDHYGEATGVRYYCTDTCRELVAVYDGSEDQEDQDPATTDMLPGTVCDYCGRPVAPVEKAVQR